jgi:phosphatidyl-myo-inositol alpha-mannosyltransferase
MKVALTCPYSWDAAGGVQVHVAQLASRLQARGHEVLVLAPGERSPREGWVELVGRPIRVRYAGTVAPLCFSASSWRRVRELLRVFEPDVVHAHEPLTPSTSMQAVLSSTAPVVATFHAHLDRSRLMELTAPLLRTVRRRIDVGIAVSQAAADFLARAIPGEVEIVPNGVEVERFADPGPPAVGLPPGRRILWVNRLDPQKGFPVTVRAFERLAGRLDDVTLVVAGGGRDRRVVDGLPKAVRRRVVMLGPVPHEDLPAYHASADVFVSPALGQESFGIVLVEAMAAGVPVVATNIPGYREVIRPDTDGLLVPPGSVGALADAMERLLEDEELAARLSDAGRERALAYSWAVVLPKIEGIYGRVVDGGRPARPDRRG